MSTLRSLLHSLGIGSLLSQQIPFQHKSHPLASECGLDVQSPSSTTYSGAPSCPTDGPLSCHSSGEEASCCFIAPGGQLLQTQFWDTAPAVGPANSWTLHGLWPDLCNGAYDQYCTSAPQYHNISAILTSFAQDDLLEFMNTYWLPNAGTNEEFWEHEWNKHGTCVNTLAPACYGDSYLAGAEVVDFFTRAVGVFKTLDTYAALAAAGIVPSTTETYTAAQIQLALQAISSNESESSSTSQFSSGDGSARRDAQVIPEVVIACTSSGELNQAWYAYNVRGSLQTGVFVPTPAAGQKKEGSCPEEGIRYLPKGR